MVLDGRQYSLHSAQRTIRDGDLVAAFQVRPRFSGHGRIYDSRYGVNFALRNGDRFFARSNDGEDARRGQDWQTNAGIEPAEQVSGKERLLQHFDSVGPAPFNKIRGQERI